MESSEQMKNPSKRRASKIKVFQLAREKFAILGIIPELAVQPYPLNRKILLGFSILGLSSGCIFEFTFYEAKTFIEYTQSSYMGSYMVTIIFALFIITFKMEKIFELFDDCENLINTSE